MTIDDIILFIVGMGVGCVITFFTLILFAQVMEKKQKQALIKMGKEKVK